MYLLALISIVGIGLTDSEKLACRNLSTASYHMALIEALQFKTVHAECHASKAIYYAELAKDQKLIKKIEYIFPGIDSNAWLQNDDCLYIKKENVRGKEKP